MIKPKLLIVYPNQFGYHTDSYIYCKYLYKQYDISYVCIDQGFERLVLPGVEVVYMPYNSSKIKRLYNFLKLAIKKSKELRNPTCLVIQFKFSGILPLFLSSQLTILDYRTGDLNNSKVKRTFNNWVMRVDSFFYQRVSVISAGLRDVLHLNKNAQILPLGADEISAQSKDYSCLSLLYVGAIHHRNIYQTVEGLGLFLQRFPSYKNELTYDIIGFGNQKDIQQLIDCIVKFKLHENVTFHGRKPYNELYPYFDKCTIGISYIPITDYYQHQPATKTFEYALSGLYTIATATLENQKVIGLENGVLCQDTPEGFAQAMEYIVENRHTFNEREIRNSLKEYHWKNIVETKLMPLLQP